MGAEVQQRSSVLSPVCVQVTNRVLFMCFLSRGASTGPAPLSLNHRARFSLVWTKSHRREPGQYSRSLCVCPNTYIQEDTIGNQVLAPLPILLRWVPPHQVTSPSALMVRERCDPHGFHVMKLQLASPIHVGWSTHSERTECSPGLRVFASLSPLLY